MCEIQREREIPKKSDRDTTLEDKEHTNTHTLNVFIMSGIGMTPHWGLLVSLYIQW